MKLAEALMLRADMQNKLASLRQRITNNVVVQDGEQPHEKPADLMAQAVALLDEVEALITRINTTNLQAKLPDGRSLTQVLARREKLAARHALLRVAIEATHREPDRYSMREIKWITVIDIPRLQKQADDLASQLREINASLQQANWQIELIE